MDEWIFEDERYEEYRDEMRRDRIAGDHEHGDHDGDPHPSCYSCECDEMDAQEDLRLAEMVNLASVEWVLSMAEYEAVQE
jgi:hypothetical protein